MKKTTGIMIAVFLVGMLSIAFAAVPIRAWEKPPGDEGCTPGFWKRHLEAWGPTGYAPGDSLQGVFGGNAPGVTLLEALDMRGGSGLDGAKGILARYGTAALLSAAHPDISFPAGVGDVISAVTAAFDSNDRDTILSLANQAADAFDILDCPLQ